MKTLSVTEARRQFCDLLDEVQTERVVITHHGKPVATIVGVAEHNDKCADDSVLVNKEHSQSAEKYVEPTKKRVTLLRVDFAGFAARDTAQDFEFSATVRIGKIVKTYALTWHPMPRIREGCAMVEFHSDVVADPLGGSWWGISAISEISHIAGRILKGEHFALPMIINGSSRTNRPKRELA